MTDYNPTSDAQATDHHHEQATLEPSPSTGWRETARSLDVPEAHDVEPVDAGGCGAAGCHADEKLYRVRSTSGRRVLCPDHVAGFLTREVNA